MSHRSSFRSLPAVAFVFGWAAITLAATPTVRLKPGTVLPAELRTSLHSSKSRPGDAVKAIIQQDVPGTRIRKGARITGKIVDVTPATPDRPAAVTVRFDTLQTKAERIAILTSLRALASFMDVQAAQVPLTGPDRGTPQNWWTIRQIGGQMAYGWGIAPGSEGGAQFSEDGLTGKLIPGRAEYCRTPEADDSVQALWLFSLDACGLYGLRNLTLERSGITEPFGEITLVAAPGKVVDVHSGSGMLLQVLGSR